MGGGGARRPPPESKVHPFTFKSSRVFKDRRVLSGLGGGVKAAEGEIICFFKGAEREQEREPVELKRDDH